MIITTRREAKLVGMSKYFTGKPCKNGHVAERYVQSGTCSECINGSVSSARLGKSETFDDAADKLELTALTEFNANLQRITAMYEEALVKASKLRNDAKNMRNELKNIDDKKGLMLDLTKLTSIFVQYKPETHVLEEQEYLSLIQQLNPNFTLDHLRIKDESLGKSWFKIRCRHEDLAMIKSKHTVHSHRGHTSIVA